MKFSTTALLSSALVMLSILRASAQPTPNGLTLTQNGQTRYVIVLANDAIPSEQTAATQLQEQLLQVTGATFAVKPEAEVAANVPQILVGAGSRVKRLMPRQNWSTLGTDGIVIQTAGQNLILAGGRPRGALYAVFEFLEKSVGIRWWTPTESTFPQKSTLHIPAQNVVYTPQIRTREVFYNSVTQDALFATRMKINGHYQPQNEMLGGHNSLLGWCHTFDQLLLPEKYFKEHPEWYSDPYNNGLPCTASSKMPHSQLDLTNDEMRAELTKVALEWIGKNPNAGMISISQNDNQEYSRSPGDMAIIEREGSPAGALLHFVNQVAADIEKVYPNFLVETLAYQYTRKAPKTIRPRKNVVVRLCSFEADFVNPIDSDANAGFRDDVLAWKAISPQLYIWDYTTNFGNVIYPHPNLRVLGSNIRFFAANNAIGVFEQGDAYSNGVGDFVQLRAWLLSHLLWNPQQDEKKLIDEFMKGYYGGAAPSLTKYLNLIVDSYEATGAKLPTGSGNDNYLTMSVMSRASTLFAEAAKAVEGNDVLSKRVRRARLPLDHAWILRYSTLQRQAMAEGKPFEGPKDISAAAEDFITTAQSFNVYMHREGGTFADYIPLLRRRIAPSTKAELPEELRGKVAPGTEAQNVIDIQQNQFRLVLEGVWVKVVDDAAASDGKAARMTGDMAQWAIQCGLDVKAGEVWHCYVVARIDAKVGAPQTGGALGIGIYDEARRSGIASLSKSLPEMADGKYQLLDLGVHLLNPSTYFFAHPVNNPNVEAVYIDRIILMREEPLQP